MDIDIQSLHTAEISILEELDKVCKTLGIRYFACYGTALGAVRHKGFIPWDDDIDVGMLREDYERFRKEAPALLPPHLFYQNYDTENDYFLSHAKLRDSRTTFIEDSWKDYQWNHGVFIDIFPFDYVPQHPLRMWMVHFKKRFYQNIIVSIDKTRKYWKEPGWKSKLRALLKPLALLIYKNRPAVEKKLDDMLAALPPSDRVCAYEDPYVYHTAWFKSTVDLPFEQHTIPLPVGYDEMLTAAYGDYMTPPPVEHQKAVHTASTVDLARSYSHYVSSQGQ
ncbi:MAG: LicD family protein [Akkermansia sp.]|nr:LicD family protein [Akkermansia sp.]